MKLSKYGYRVELFLAVHVSRVILHLTEQKFLAHTTHKSKGTT